MALLTSLSPTVNSTNFSNKDIAWKSQVFALMKCEFQIEWYFAEVSYGVAKYIWGWSLKIPVHGSTSHVTCLAQSRADKNTWWIIRSYMHSKSADSYNFHNVKRLGSFSNYFGWNTAADRRDFVKLISPCHAPRLERGSDQCSTPLLPWTIRSGVQRAYYIPQCQLSLVIRNRSRIDSRAWLCSACLFNFQGTR